MTSKVLFAMLTGVALALGSTGCGGGGDATDDPSPTPTPTPGTETRKIVFVSSDTRSGGLDQEIYIMNADGSGRTRLTTNAFRDSDPALSPDGATIVYTRPNDTRIECLYLMGADGSNPRKIVDLSTNLIEPRWSRDGTKLVFWDFSRRIIVARADGSGASPVPNATSGDSPDFSPDGTKIVYSHSTEREIYVINVDGTGKTKLTSTPDVKEFAPRWSPDGTKLVCFTETAGAPSQLVVLNADGSGRTSIRTESSIQKPSWSPSGAKIVFHNYGSNEIYTMNPDGSGAANRTNKAASDDEPSW